MKFENSILIFISITLPLKCLGDDSETCDSEPPEMYAIGALNKETIKIEEEDTIQVIGEGVPLIKSAFLTFDSSCHFLAYTLKQQKSKAIKKADDAKILREYVMEHGMIRSNDEKTDFFFCTDPMGNGFNRMVTIPEGKDYQTVYVMMPVLVSCLLLSATFSGLNLAIMSFSITDLKLIQGSDNSKLNRQRAGDVLRLRRHSNLVLVTIIFGNCVCNTSITILLNYFGDFYGFSNFGYVELTATVLLLIFTEILPSLICTKNALTIASRMQYFVIFAIIVTLPVSYPLSKLLDRILGKENADESAPIEIGSIQLEALLYEGIDDDLGLMNLVQKTLETLKKKAEDVMTPIDEVGMISDRQKLTWEFLNSAQEKGHSRMPVYDGENKNKIRGVLNITDVMLLVADDGVKRDTDLPDLTAGTLLGVLDKRRKHCFALNTLPVQQLKSELQRGCTMAIVVEYTGDEDDSDEETDETAMENVEKMDEKSEKKGSNKERIHESYKVIGIITLEDYMEEIIGEISDEKDKKEK